MNNFPFNNLNLLQNLAMIRSNIMAQSGLGENAQQTPAANTLLTPANQQFIPFQGQAQGQVQAQTQTPQNPMQPSFLNQNLETIINESSLLERTKLENQQILKYIQNTMKMPETIEKFIKEIAGKNVSESTIEKFIDSMLDTKVINEFLNQNSKAAIEKMLLTIANSIKTGGSDVAQLKEMLSVLTTIHHNTIADTNTLRELLLLYIPLNCPVFDSQMELKKVIENQDEKIKNSSLSILFQTINFSNVLCCMTSENNDVLIELFSIEDFPYKEFEKIVQIIAKEAHLNIRFDFMRINVVSSDESKQNFRIISNDFIPSNVLIVAHLLIKTLFQFDDKFFEKR